MTRAFPNRSNDVPEREVASRGDPWRIALRRELLWALSIKSAALALLWLLCVDSAHTPAIDAVATSQHLALIPPDAQHE